LMRRPETAYLCFGLGGMPYGLLPGEARELEEEQMVQNKKTARLAAMAQERASEKGIGYRAGLSEICAEHPHLASEALYESRGVMLWTIEKSGMDGHMPFSPAPTQPINKWLIDLAKARAEQQKIDFGIALAQIKRENPQLADAAGMEVTGGKAQDHGPNFLKLMRRALEIARAKSLDVKPAMERAAAEDPDLAEAARRERGGSLYASELLPAPGIGDKQVLMSEGVDAALDPSAQLVMLSEDRCRERSISYAEALVQIAREHPELVRAAREQALGRKLY
jgi:hypothetical protein